MNKIKKILRVMKNIMPKGANFKYITITALIHSLCELIILFVFAYFGIDRAFKENSVSLFIIVICSIFVAQVISNITYSMCFRKGNELTKNICIETREKIFEKVMELDKEYYNTHPTGAIINTVVGDVEVVGEGLFWPIMGIITYSTNILIPIIICFFINYKLSLIVLVLAPIIIFITKYTFNKLSKIDDKRRESKKKILSHINDGVMGIKTIKTLNLEEKNNIDYYKLSKERYKWNIKRHNLGQLMWRGVDVINVIAIAVLFYLSYNEYVTYALSYGELYLFFLLFEKSLYCMSYLSNTIEEFSDIVLSAEKIDALLNRKPLIEDKENIDLNPEKLKGKIEFENVTFKYPKGEMVLKDFNLKIKPRTKVALVGRTGSGKSTIASLVYRFYEPTKGKILFDDKDYTDLPQKFIKNSIGFILQDSLLFDDTIMNNIRYGKREASEEEVIRICEKIGLNKFIEEMPNKYNTKVGEGGLLLSNGQKQLISFARVLLKNPDIIILDEATSSVDSLTEQLIQNCINNEFKNKTCIFIAHRLSTIKDVDNIVYLDKGKIIEQGNHEELMNKKGMYYKLYSSQFYNKLLHAELGIQVDE